jgi:hypothetical protein
MVSFFYGLDRLKRIKMSEPGLSQIKGLLRAQMIFLILHCRSPSSPDEGFLV